MSRPGLSESDVAEAIDTLKTAGLSNPSIRAIHQKLGRGSLTTISTHKRAIEAARREADGQGLPDPIVASLTSLADQLWTELTEAADERIGLVDKEARERIAAAEQGREAALQTASDAEHRLSAVTVELEVVKRQLAEAQGQNATISKAMIELRQQNGEQRERIGGLEALREEKIASVQLLMRQAEQKDLELRKASADMQALVQESRRDRRTFESERMDWEQRSESFSQKAVEYREIIAARTAELQLSIEARQSVENELNDCQRKMKSSRGRLRKRSYKRKHNCENW